jgi:hypothetical protein
MAQSAPLPRFNVAVSLRDALHEVRLVRGNLEGQIDRLDRLERELSALLPSYPAGIDCEPTIDLGQVAHNLDIRSRPNGSAVVSIDGGRKFALAQQPAEFFWFIASGDKDRGGSDPLVGWRSRSEILEFLAQSAERCFHPRYINNLVHRVKNALRKAGYSPGLIQTHRQKGLRFALKRGPRVSSPVSSDLS